MMKVSTGAAGFKSAKALRPNVLSIPAVTAVILAGRGGIRGVEGNDLAVFVLAIGDRRKISSIIVRRFI